MWTSYSNLLMKHPPLSCSEMIWTLATKLFIWWQSGPRVVCFSVGLSPWNFQVNCQSCGCLEWLSAITFSYPGLWHTSKEMLLSEHHTKISLTSCVDQIIWSLLGVGNNKKSLSTGSNWFLAMSIMHVNT